VAGIAVSFVIAAAYGVVNFDTNTIGILDFGAIVLFMAARGDATYQ
jgi:hypothetical protein